MATIDSMEWGKKKKIYQEELGITQGQEESGEDFMKRVITAGATKFEIAEEKDGKSIIAKEK